MRNKTENKWETFSKWGLLQFVRKILYSKKYFWAPSCHVTTSDIPVAANKTGHCFLMQAHSSTVNLHCACRILRFAPGTTKARYLTSPKTVSSTSTLMSFIHHLSSDFLSECLTSLFLSLIQTTCPVKQSLGFQYFKNTTWHTNHNVLPVEYPKLLQLLYLGSENLFQYYLQKLANAMIKIASVFRMSET